MSPSPRSLAAQELLQSIPARLRKNGMQKLSDGSALLTTGKALSALSSDLPEKSAAKRWREQLENGNLPIGKVVELCVTGPSWGTSLALAACRNAQQRSKSLTGQTAWCAFVDPTASLYAPGVFASGVDLSRLLVVRPDEENLSRVALRLAESKTFPVVVVDLMSLPGSHIEVNLAAWVKVVRRISLSLEDSQNTVVLLTEQSARRPLALPVAQRIELSRTSREATELCVSKDTQGTFLPPTKVQFDSLRKAESHAS